MSGPLISVSCTESVWALTCLCSGVWGQRMLFQGHCWCGTKWTSPGGRPVTSSRPLTVSTTAVTSLGHTEQSLFDTAWLWWIATIGPCCLFSLEQSWSGFSVKLCVSKHMRHVTSQTEYKSLQHFSKIDFFFFTCTQIDCPVFLEATNITNSQLKYEVNMPVS